MTVIGGGDGCPVDSQDYEPCSCQTNGVNLSLECASSKTLNDSRVSQVFKAFLSTSDNNSQQQQRLVSVEIENSQLTHIPQEITLFNWLQNVQLSGNHIRSIRSGAFNFISPLKTLNLSANGLENIEPGAFQGKTIQSAHLKKNLNLCESVGNYGDGSWIILSHNNLTRIEARVFKQVLEQMMTFGGSPHTMLHIDNSIYNLI